MLARLKSAARQKLQRALAEVVEAEFASTRGRLEDMHAQQLAKLQDLTAQLDAVNGRFVPVFDRLHEMEQRARRDISYARDIRSTADSAAFVREHMPKVQVFWNPHDTLRFALGEV